MAPDDFLATPSEEAALRYYAEVLARLNHPPVEVRLDSGGGRGKGLFVTKPVKRGQVLWCERPLAGCQSLESRAAVSSCAGCHCCTGTLERHVGEKLVAAVTQAEEEAEEARASKDRVAAAEAARRAARLERAVDPRDLQVWLRPLESLRRGDGEDDGDDDPPSISAEEAERRRLPLAHLLPRRFLRAPAPVPCRERCGAEFCSAACESKSWERWHCLLCPGNSRRRQQQQQQQQQSKGKGKGKAAVAAAAAPDPSTVVVEAGVRVDRAAVERFLENADGHNDIFRVAAQVVALMLTEADRLLNDKAEATPRAALQRAALPFAAAHRKPWWECVARPEDVSPGDEEEEFRAQLRSLAADSLALLSEALKPERGELGEALLLSSGASGSASSSSSSSSAALDAYGSLVGMFELNNLALNVPPPLDAYVALLNGDELPSARDEGEEEDAEAASSSSSPADPALPSEAERDAAAAMVAPLLDAMGDDLAGAGTQGTAFYALQSCCNHACAPAARAEGRCRGDVALVALRDLQPGEELTISYLPLDDEVGVGEDGEDGEEEEDGEEKGQEDDGEARPPPVVPMPLAERRAALRDYGFECACERCEAEELAEAVGGC